MLEAMIKDITTYRFTNDPDIDYAALMKIHHLAAIQMAEREKDWGKNDSVIMLAKHIAHEESDEIDFFDQFEHSHKADQQREDFVKEAQEVLSHKHIAPETGNIDKVFTEMMIQHHESAIRISEIYLKYGKDDQMVKVARENLLHHRKNILDLKSIQNCCKN